MNVLIHSRKLAILCLAFVALAVSLASAQPASAASFVSYCFKPSTGGAWMYQPVYLQKYTTSGWQGVLKAEADSTGCGGFNIGTTLRSYNVRVVAHDQVVSSYGGVVTAVWVGVTPLMALPGDARVNLGTGIVYCYGPWPCMNY